MSAKVKAIELFIVELPFKKAFSHALYTRTSSDSIFVKVCLEDGITGYGESLPRKYVTGETTMEAGKTLLKDCLPALIGAEFASLGEVSGRLDQCDTLKGAAKCAVEVALMDAVGKQLDVSISTLLGGDKRDSVFYSGVMSAGSVKKAAIDAIKFKVYGFKQIKVKVGLDNDLERLNVIRCILGKRVDIRVDANCAWTARTAIDKINSMRKFGISAVEQPVVREDLEGLKMVTAAVPEAIVVDESLCTINDAENLSKEKACDMFNIRLSKCGGLTNSLRIAEIARNNSIRCQLGCQAGESGVLSAVGRHFACALKDIEYAEGSYGTFLLKEDVTVEDMTFKRMGLAGEIYGPGVGVRVSDSVLEKYVVERFRV